MQSIAVIVTWFGKLPNYFPYWFLSAKYNHDVDFYILSDSEIPFEADNITVIRTSMEMEVKRLEAIIERPVRIENSYKFCDLRPYFGLMYSNLVKGYDFWGYCDIDLAFGRLRDFFTPERLERYDRFYQYGHLSLFRNNAKMNNLLALPGSIYTLDEILTGKAKTTPEEHFGINRICVQNNIPWYTKADFGDFVIKYPKRLEVKHGLKNHANQVFYWYKGKAKRAYILDGEIHTDEFVYLHWQKRRLNVTWEKDCCQAGFIINPDSLVPLKDEKQITTDFILSNNRPLSSLSRMKFRLSYNLKKMNEFTTSSLPVKGIWLRQKFTKAVSKTDVP